MLARLVFRQKRELALAVSLLPESTLQIQANDSSESRAPLGKGEFQRSTQAILRIFVAPGVPNGTPAVMTTRWPTSAIFSRCAIRTAFCTMSPKLFTSLVCTQCAPHKTASRRAVPRFEVRTRTGDAGRSRAARRAVAPDVV